MDTCPPHLSVPWAPLDSLPFVTSWAFPGTAAPGLAPSPPSESLQLPWVPLALLAAYLQLSPGASSLAPALLSLLTLPCECLPPIRASTHPASSPQHHREPHISASSPEFSHGPGFSRLFFLLWPSTQGPASPNTQLTTNLDPGGGWSSLTRPSALPPARESPRPVKFSSNASHICSPLFSSLSSASHRHFSLAVFSSLPIGPSAQEHPP